MGRLRLRDLEGGDLKGRLGGGGLKRRSTPGGRLSGGRAGRGETQGETQTGIQGGREDSLHKGSKQKLRF